MDTVKLVAIAHGLAVFTAIVTAVILVYHNSDSQNLVLGVGALVGASLVFFIQAYFELQPLVTEDRVSTEYTIDRAAPAVRQWNYSFNNGWRVTAEPAASEWLSKERPGAFEEDRAKLVRDIAQLSFVRYLETTANDWKAISTVYQGKVGGTLVSVRGPGAIPGSSRVESGGLHANLARVGNTFGHMPVRVGEGVYVPNGTQIVMKTNGLTIEHPAFQVEVDIDVPTTTLCIDPEKRTTAELPDGKGPRFETRHVNFRIQTTIRRWRAKSPQTAEYRAWIGRLVDGAREWFER
jgi:hypothetical protein